MKVDSYLEIFTTMYGWAFANIISSAIVGTGLVVVPFFVIIFKKWLDVKEQGMQAGGIMSLLESAQTRLLVALFVATLCFFHAPGVSLKSVDLSYQAPATLLESNPQEVSRDKGTASTYDDAMDDFGSDKVPLWWFSVMAMSSGFNSAIRDALGSFENITREIQASAQLATIEKPELRTEAERFKKECFGAATQRFYQLKSEGKLPQRAVELAEARKDALTWMGSILFLDVPGFYDDLPAGAPVEGFGKENDTQGQSSASVSGRPLCKDWWLGSGSTKGLLDKLVEHSRPAQSTLTQLTNAISKGASGLGAGVSAALAGQNPLQAAKDAVVRQMLQQTAGSVSIVDTSGVNQDFAHGARSGFSSAIGTIGVAWNGFKMQMWRQPLLTGLPMAQALLLMGLYTFLPLAVFLSGYDLRAFFLGTVALFTIKLFASLWLIAQWMDAKLVEAMFPGYLINGLAGAIGLTGTSGQEDNYKMAILDTLLVGMLIGLPLLWMSVMGWLGIHLNAAVTSVMGAAERHAQQAAETSAAAVKYAATTAVRVATPKK
ncbi:MAG: conjugal transfer protein TraG N-terminal domain-containing protein [Actinomycetaceae bacterium]|nr:conjugal transfer protein TraG N-terminal domain-containing protein [Actinomycetaceae bacterium]